MKVSHQILLWILELMFGKLDQPGVQNYSRKQRREALAVYKRSARRYERFIKHVRDKLGSEVFADADFAEHVRRTAEEYAQEFIR